MYVLYNMIKYSYWLVIKDILIVLTYGGWFQENYGNPDPSKVAKVKALYKELDIQVWTWSCEDIPFPW